MLLCFFVYYVVLLDGHLQDQPANIVEAIRLYKAKLAEKEEAGRLAAKSRAEKDLEVLTSRPTNFVKQKDYLRIVRR